MSASGFSFAVAHVDRNCAARRSTLVTPHGPVQMPAFMPVGTVGSVKGILVEQLREIGV